MTSQRFTKKRNKEVSCLDLSFHTLFHFHFKLPRLAQISGKIELVKAGKIGQNPMVFLMVVFSMAPHV